MSNINKKMSNINASELEQANERLELALYGGNLGMWDWHMPSGKVIFNQRWCEMLGWRLDEVAEEASSWSDRVHPDDWAIINASLIPHKKGETARYECEHRMRHKDGSYLWFLDSGKVVDRDNEGHAVRMVGTLRDITEQKNLEAQQLAVKEAAEIASGAKSEFLSSMSHELRTPMNAVLGFAQVMQFDDTLSVQSKDNVEQIIKAGQHVLILINDVLDLAKIESGRIELSEDHVDVPELVADCLRMLQSLAISNQVRVTSSVDFSGIIQADQKRLKQIFLNLLSNAIKYNHPGGTVMLNLKVVADNRLGMTISNTGKGFLPERNKELFIPFNRLGHENSGIEGTGIGLAITRKLLELMDGTIEMKSQPNVMTTVKVDLPFLITRPVSDTPLADAVQSTEAQAAPLHQHRVLYIDDASLNLQLMEGIFHQRPQIKLESTLDPEVGIDMATSNPPELILLDILMPVLNGYQVLEILRADKRTANIPVFAITANAMADDVERGRQAGFDHYLTKPLNVVHLLACIDEVLVGKKDND